jgi:AraC-like DNA-binding protein
MASRLARPHRTGIERSCVADEWVETSGPIDGVELFRAGLRGHPYSRHRHDVYAVGVTEAGAQAFHYRGTVERSAPGQVFVLHPDEPHDGWADGPDLLGYAQVYIAPARIADALPAITGRPTPLPFAAPVTDDPMLARTIRAAFQATTEPLALDALVLELAEGLLRCRATAARAPDRPSRFDLPALKRGREFLDNQPAVVRSSELEAVTGHDRYRFARQFRALYGTSPYRYSVMRRLDLARDKLSMGRPLAETANAAGFADQAHFTRMFKAAFGMTPGSYARLSRAPGPNPEP